MEINPRMMIPKKIIMMVTGLRVERVIMLMSLREKFQAPTYK
jgi:hypothetical protein